MLGRGSGSVISPEGDTVRYVRSDSVSGRGKCATRRRRR